jgi:hypothetical protein
VLAVVKLPLLTFLKQMNEVVEVRECNVSITCLQQIRRILQRTQSFHRWREPGHPLFLSQVGGIPEAPISIKYALQLCSSLMNSGMLMV